MLDEIIELEFEIMNEIDVKDEFKSKGNEMVIKALHHIANCSLVAQESDMKHTLIIDAHMTCAHVS